MKTFKSKLIEEDPWLEPFGENLERRYAFYQERRKQLIADYGSIETASSGHHYFGFNEGERDGQPGVWYREWAPEAEDLFLIGDFNDWDRGSHPMTVDENGVWEIFLPEGTLKHGTKLKVHVIGDNGGLDRIPAYATRVVQEEDLSFTAVYWCPKKSYSWKNDSPGRHEDLFIYEAHVGIAQEKDGMGTFDEMREEVLPRIKKQGYNAIQLMAIAQHPYYASFGYHVSSFYAVSSYFGEPEDLKRLIDAAHGMGIIVLLDLVHSHTVKNINEGLNQFDGSQHQYFHAGGRGEHLAWDSKLFNYGKSEVLRFLLSNVRYWLEEYKFDGFRFDGITSMLYQDHGLSRDFGPYEDYFEEANLDLDAIAYLQLANELTHSINPEAITVAEDVSGMPGLAREIHYGGIGFDYRLAMGIPDNWIKILKEKNDEDWHMGTLFHILCNRRQNEKHVAYCESHDQALVGDKTIAFWLMDEAMYTSMNKDSENLIVDRGIALHKMIRLLTLSLGGEAWLNFIGNEFGHPEWIDFPREGNNFSYHYARRQWSLVDNDLLRYKDLNEFDQAMLQLIKENHILKESMAHILNLHEDNKLLCFQKGKLVFLFNFHAEKSFVDYRIGMREAGTWKLVLDSDHERFGGFNRIAADQEFFTQDEPWDEQQQSIQVYLPNRSVQVLRKS